MKHYDREKLKKRILRMIIVPALITIVLLLIAWVGGKRTHNSREESAAALQSTEDEKGLAESEKAGGGAENGGSESGQNGVESEKAGGEAKESDAEPERAGEESEQAGAETGAEDAASADAEIIELEPMQKISFSAGGDNEAQRSVPVRLDTAILGGEKGEKCWAVFLPAEMAEHPRICFSEYKTVTMEALGEGEYYNGARLGPVNDDNTPADNPAANNDGNTSGNGPGAHSFAEGSHTYSSGDEVSGLVNGSAFSVTLEEKGGGSQSDVLYVFSCTGTATMYLDTESGSMEAVDADETKETREKAKYTVFLPDGQLDSTGDCAVSGRGNSTWSMVKRPYDLKLTKKQSILGMQKCKKLCLLANTFDMTNLLDRVSSQLALELKMRDTPQGEFVNLYLNGQYNGLYFLSQRPRTGGSVKIDKMDDRILEANGLEDFSTVPERIALHEEGDKLIKWAYDWPNEPVDNTGGYLLQQYTKYEGDGAWFTTVHRRIRIMSPEYPTAGQVNYISDYMLAAERAIYSEDGKDPETGKKYSDYLDLPSWLDMFLLEEYFVEWDAERWSFYIIKDKKDSHLHCAPMWDFDHSAGAMIYGTYPETAVSTLMFRDSRQGWMQTLLSHDEFAEALNARWKERFSPVVHRFLDNRMEEEIAEIESAAYMNNIRRSNDLDFREKTDALTDWLQRRVDFLDSYAGAKGIASGKEMGEEAAAEDGKTAAEESGQAGADQYCRVLFKFPWGDLSHYVIPGESLGYLPLPEYGETQIPSEVEKREIIGWLDEDGNKIGADIVIDRDRTFTAQIRQ